MTRPTKYGTGRMRPVSVYLTAEQKALARADAPNLSEGLRVILAVWAQMAAALAAGHAVTVRRGEEGEYVVEVQG